MDFCSGLSSRQRCSCTLGSAFLNAFVTYRFPFLGNAILRARDCRNYAITFLVVGPSC